MIRADLAGSYLWSPSPTRALQDPLSYRSFSHVLGSAEDVLARVRSQLTIQMNRSDDNPTVLVDAIPPAGATAQERSYYVEADGLRGAVIPTSNFEPLPWVLQLESLAVALAHVSGTSVQRTSRLATEEFTHLSRFLTAEPDSIGFAAIQKVPADFDAENRHLANPVSLDAIPLAGDIEDTATNAAAAATNVTKIVDNLYAIFGVDSCTPPKRSTCDSATTPRSPSGALPSRSCRPTAPSCRSSPATGFSAPTFAARRRFCVGRPTDPHGLSLGPPPYNVLRLRGQPR